MPTMNTLSLLLFYKTILNKSDSFLSATAPMLPFLPLYGVQLGLQSGMRGGFGFHCETL